VEGFIARFEPAHIVNYLLHFFVDRQHEITRFPRDEEKEEEGKSKNFLCFNAAKALSLSHFILIIFSHLVMPFVSRM
jgi:hypothetical protein